MPATLSTVDFWKLLVESHLTTASTARELEEKFVELKGDGQANTVTLAQWLMAEEVLSRYQAKVLLAGRPGPFVYGDYTVYDRHSEGRLQGTFRATHPGTRHRVLLYFHTGPVVQDAKRWSIVVEQIAKFSKAVHPHLARVYHLCDLGQFKFTVMDDLQGESAEERVAKGPVSAPVACRIIRQAAQGIAKLLQLGQLHGAIRPSNLWIDKQGNAEVLLPPLARDLLAVPKPLDMSGADSNGELLRQADYLAPEMTQPKHCAGTTDGSLCPRLYDVLSADRPRAVWWRQFESKTCAHASEPIPALDLAVVPVPVAQVIGFAMAKDPAKRFRDPGQLAETLGKMLEKLDRTQLRWPPSLPPSRLPEYESWLHPYGVRAEEPGRASGLNVLWSKDDELLPDRESHPPAAIAEAPRTAVREPLRAPLGVIAPSAAPVEPDSPLDWIGADPRKSRKTNRQHANNKMAVFITTLLAILCVIGAVVMWWVLSKRPKAEGTAAKGLSEVVKQVSSNSTDPSSSSKSDTKLVDRTVERQEAAAAKVGASGSNGDAVELTAANDSGHSDAQSDSSPPEPATAANSLWVSPTSGSPLSLTHVAAGLQAALILRPAELLRQPEGEKVAAAIGPDADSARRELESVIGRSLADVEQLTIAWVESMSTAPSGLTPMFVIRFQNPPDQQKLTAQWGKQSSSSAAEKVFQTPQGLAAYWPGDEAGKVLVLGPSEQVEEVARRGASPPLLRREFEKLLTATDADRLATLLFVPGTALNENGEPPTNSWQMLLGPGRLFFGDDVRAAAVSADLTKDALFIELRVQGPLDRPAAIVAQQFQERLAKLPNAVESYIAALNLNPYGKRLLLRYPQMIKLLDEFTRSGADGNQAVLRSYLPAAAAQNLLMGAELALAEGAGQSSLAEADSSSTESAAKPPETVDQKLKRVTSLIFARDTLERAIQLLADDIGLKAEILGSDLQLEGITKNQSFGLDEKDKPADEILAI